MEESCEIINTVSFLCICSCVLKKLAELKDDFSNIQEGVLKVNTITNLLYHWHCIIFKGLYLFEFWVEQFVEADRF